MKYFWYKNKFFRIIILISLILIIALGFSFFEFRKNFSSDILVDFKKGIFEKDPYFYDKVAQFIQDNNKEIPSQIEKLNLPLFTLKLSRKDVAHFTDIYDKTESGSNLDILYYQANNKWRKADLEYNGQTYKIEIKSHGVDPTGHRAEKYISYSIKFQDNQQINHVRRFNLIIYDRIRDKRLLVYDLARRFNILINEPELVRVQINNWDEKLYYFEPRLNNEFLEILDKSSFQIFEDIDYGDKSSIIGYENEFNETKFAEYFQKIFEDLNYPLNSREPLYDHYLSLNRAIVNHDFKTIDRFFDFDYITNFMAARTIAGHTGHGVARSNFYIFLDIASGKFYPTMRRDNVPSALVACENCAIEKQINYWDHFDARQNFLDLIDQNDLLRQEKYRKIYEFIQNEGADIDEKHQQIIIEDNKKHYFGWFKLLLSRLGLGLDEIVTGHNIEVLKSYLEESSPELTVSMPENYLMIEFSPHSMSAIDFEELTLNQLASKTPFTQKVDLKLITLVSDEVIESAEMSHDVYRDNRGLHLGEVIKNLFFADTLGEDGQRLSREYILIFDLNTANQLILAKENLSLGLINKVTGQKINISDITWAESKEAELKTFQEIDIVASKNECLEWQKNNNHLRSTCASNFELIIHPGRYLVKNDLIIPHQYKLILESGVSLFLDEGVSIFGYHGFEVRGTARLPVTITAIDPRKPFGSVGILGDNEVSSSINYLNLSHGREAWHEGAYFSGGLSIHYNKEVYVANSTIFENQADDGINIKYADDIIIKNSIFKNNAVDQIDLDYVTGLVINSTFFNEKLTDANGDGLDVSGSKILARANEFMGFKDKGISVGERAEILIYGNNFKENKNAVAIKDLSRAYIFKNTFSENEIDINVYQKKQIWGGGSVYVLPEYQDESILNIVVDEVSNIYHFSDDFDLEELDNTKVDDILRIFQEIFFVKIN